MPDREVNAETRVSDEKEAAARLMAEALRDVVRLTARTKELEAENERLREALGHIARARVLPQWAWQVARAALAETQENAE